MRKKIALSLICLMAAGAADAGAPTLKAESGYKVNLRNMAFQDSEDGGTVTGWASRALGAFGSIEAHLHVDLIGAHKEILHRMEHGWFGRLPVRPERSERIRVSLSNAQLNGVEAISVKVAPGRMHD